METILVSQLQKSYGAVEAVVDLSLSVEAGEIFGMLGPNGAGKTTTVEILIGLRKRGSGEVKVLGMDPERRSRELKSRIGVQLQVGSMYPRLTVQETVKLFASFYLNPLPAQEIISLTGLDEKAKVHTKDLSGGQLQRLAIALALISNGEIIFLDEPTTGLDPQARHGVWDLIRDLKSRGKTVFLTTHYMDEAERLCDRVAVVDHGRIIAEGSPKALIDEHFPERALEFSQDELATKNHLRELPGVQRIQRQEDATTLYTTDPSQTIAGLLDYAARNNVTIEDITLRRATLEDVFLKLTGRRIRT